MLILIIIVMLVAETIVDLTMGCCGFEEVRWTKLYTPKFFREYTIMNWVGCWFCSILIHCFMPLGALCRLCYWLFHL